MMRNKILTVERFAEICGLIDLGFVSQTEVLALAGVDAASWRAAGAEWQRALAAQEATELAERFERAYTAARKRGTLTPELQAANVPPHAETARAPTGDTASIAEASVDAEEDRTAELVIANAGAVLPFRPRAFATSTPDVALPGSPGDNTDSTLELGNVPLPKGTPMPFVPPRPTVGKWRLQRFDTQSGQPLASPIWVEEPEPPSSRGPS